MKCIDSHAHLAHGHKGFHELVDSGVFDEIWLMDLSGYRFGHLELASQNEVLEAVKAHPGQVSAFGHLSFSGSPDEVNRLKDRGFWGLKPYKPAGSWNDERYYPFYERAEQLGMPMLFHTGMAVRAGEWRKTAARGRGYGPDGMRPSALAGIGEAFPKLKIIGGHLGYPWIDETIHNIYYCDNIVHDISGYRNTDAIGTLLRNLDRKCQDGTGRYFIDKFFFATDQFYGLPEENARAKKLKEFWQLMFELVGGTYYRWGDPENAEKFFYGNAHRFHESVTRGSIMP